MKKKEKKNNEKNSERKRERERKSRSFSTVNHSSKDVLSKGSLT